MRIVTRNRILLVLALVLSVLVAAERMGAFRTEPSGSSPAVETLTIETGDGRLVPFRVELALTAEQKMQGLMHRDHLDQDGGMLFLSDTDDVMGMWMKNTLIPLDIVFITADGRIANIVPDAVPGDLTPLMSRGPVRAVLEINGGLASKLGLKSGDRVLYPAFGPDR